MTRLFSGVPLSQPCLGAGPRFMLGVVAQYRADVLLGEPRLLCAFAANRRCRTHKRNSRYSLLNNRNDLAAGCTRLLSVFPLAYPILDTCR